MRTNPFYDSWRFLIGATGDHDRLGPAQYILVALFLALLAGSVWIAVVNWRRDPSQRTATHVTTWLMRSLIGIMWFHGSLWKLPLPVSDGFRYWTEQITQHAAFALHRDLVRDVLLPNIAILDPLTWLAELSFAVSLILGLAVRLFSTLAILFAVQLWLGLYLMPPEWPWLFVFLIVALMGFIVHGAGRSLGLDALWRREPAGPLAGHAPLARAYRLVS